MKTNSKDWALYSAGSMLGNGLYAIFGGTPTAGLLVTGILMTMWAIKLPEPKGTNTK